MPRRSLAPRSCRSGHQATCSNCHRRHCRCRTSRSPTPRQRRVTRGRPTRRPRCPAGERVGCDAPRPRAGGAPPAAARRQHDRAEQDSDRRQTDKSREKVIHSRRLPHQPAEASWRARHQPVGRPSAPPERWPYPDQPDRARPKPRGGHGPLARNVRDCFTAASHDVLEFGRERVPKWRRPGRRTPPLLHRERGKTNSFYPAFRRSRNAVAYAV